MLTEMYTRVSGKMIRLMAMEVTHTLTELHMSVNGRTISNTAKVLKHGLMEPNTRVNILKERKMEEAL